MYLCSNDDSDNPFEEESQESHGRPSRVDGHRSNNNRVPILEFDESAIKKKEYIMPKEQFKFGNKAYFKRCVTQFLPPWMIRHCFPNLTNDKE